MFRPFGHPYYAVKVPLLSSIAKYDDLLQLKTRTMRVTLVRIDHEYELFHDDLLIAKAASTLACVDRNGQVQRIPEWLLIEPADADPVPGKRSTAD